VLPVEPRIASSIGQQHVLAICSVLAVLRFKAVDAPPRLPGLIDAMSTLDGTWHSEHRLRFCHSFTLPFESSPS